MPVTDANVEIPVGHYYMWKVIGHPVVRRQTTLVSLCPE